VKASVAAEDAPLRLLGAFEDVPNLTGGSERIKRFFAEEARELITHMHDRDSAAAVANIVGTSAGP